MRIGRTVIVELALAVGSFVIFTLPVLFGSRPLEGSWAAVLVLGLLAAVPLVAVRRFPIGVVVTVGAVLVAAALGGVRFTLFVSNAGPALPIAIAVLAARYGRRISIGTSLGVLIAITIAQTLSIHWYPSHDQDAWQPILALPGWLFGDAFGTRQRFDESLQAADAHTAVEAEARIRAEERLRLSRDVHDVVSHVLGMIAVRSGVARLLLDEQPEEARQSLIEIERASRAALDELRDVLRSTGLPAGGPVGWQTLAELPTLVAGVTEVEVTFEQAGDAETYPPLVEHAVYRIVQESLTNVVRHAQARRAWVSLAHGPDRIEVTVRDDGRGGVVTEGGLGVDGMRERAELLGGTFDAGSWPGSSGGFVVRARIPRSGKGEQ